MKAVANGVLNMSTLDRLVGGRPVIWPRKKPALSAGRSAAGNRIAYRDYQDHVEAEALYDLLERDVVPAFYDRRTDGLPRRWIARMKSSIGTLCHRYNTHRMLSEYVERFYLKADAEYPTFAAAMQLAKALAASMKKVCRGMASSPAPKIWINASAEDLVRTSPHPHVQRESRSTTWRIQLYLGRLNADRRSGERDQHTDGAHAEGGHLAICSSNDHSQQPSSMRGWAARVLPAAPATSSWPFVPGSSPGP